MLSIRKILYPISIIYLIIISLRNFLFNCGILKSKKYHIPLIGIGNLSTGGTGKTPMAEYIFENFSKKFNLALLSRGYKRSSSGYIKASLRSSPKSIGDEPYQIFKKFKNLLVSVDENRGRGVNNLILENKNLDGIVLDDCFQHRSISLKLNILLTTYKDPFFNDSILPSGNLREPKNSYKRADIIVVTKCSENMKESEMNYFYNKINILKHQSLFFSSISYNKTLFGTSNIQIKDLKKSRILLVTGISNVVPLIDYLNNNNVEFDHMKFSDHHNYSSKDISKIEKEFEDRIVITTEKDYKKIKNLDLKNKLFYLEIKTKFLKNEVAFKTLISRAVI
ncbi:MAG: tetraacyldisaccharide 4'-kinase [Flavobacteriaceae bacterium]|mgnify:CR=1 FL=1|nr:tetraacyldisaccharide 4'-kinase [Flavobacteriaceae bacterium]|tara:strand:+ start:1647 stop:2657 length:1011 start_codon:yes stop_codon:yes gene_type:complete